MPLSEKNKAAAVFPLLVALQFVFPLFRENVSSLLFIVLSAAALAYAAATRQFRPDKRLLFLAIPFLAILLRGVASFSSAGILPAKNALFFLLFPITFSLLPQAAFTPATIRLYLQILKNCCAAVAVGYLVLFLYYYDFQDFFRYRYNIPHFRDFVYNETPVFRIHPTYYTTMLLPCTALALERLIGNWRRHWYEGFYIILFVGITFLLLVKLNTILILLLVTHSILFRTGLRPAGKVALLLSGGLLCAGLLIALPGVKNRFKEVVESINRPPQGAAHDSTNIRMAIINCSTELAGENYLLGIGFQNLEEAYRNCFASHYDTDFFVGKSYMSHNYFFYMLIGGGVACLLAYLWFLFVLIGRVRKINSYILWVAVASVLVTSLTEDYFYRHFGLYFFCLMFCIFYRTRYSRTLTDLA